MVREFTYMRGEQPVTWVEVRCDRCRHWGDNLWSNGDRRTCNAARRDGENDPGMIAQHGYDVGTKAAFGCASFEPRESEGG